MKIELLEILRCPSTGQKLELKEAVYDGVEVVSGVLVSEDSNNSYPILHCIPRFVPASNYADNFGMQWNYFRQTQLDSYSGVTVSGDRFWNATGWNAEELNGKWVLDLGCGAGRFAEIALKAGAKVVALDYSQAVDACYKNLVGHKNFYAIQGDVYALPLRKGFFQFVYSLGVLQHTPNVSKAFQALPPMLESGGKICVDFYEKSFKGMIQPKYWLRPLTKRMDKNKLFELLRRRIPVLLRVSNTIGSVPIVGKTLKRLVPVADYSGLLPLNAVQIAEWALLDTFDWFAPQYDNPQTLETVTRWLEKSNIVDIEVIRAGHLVGRGVRI